ncbi:hypothetical protein diail_7444 [Diaporthe ilicicola]|nr:hypothetical protein diail_7444 [Diaporthe ilicicola]
MASFSALTIYVFGATAFGVGVHTFFFSSSTTPEMKANSLAAIAMGIYYPLAAYQENRAFFIATVPMRSLSATVFWQQGWVEAAVWEGAGAALTGLALMWQAWRESLAKEKSHTS